MTSLALPAFHSTPIPVCKVFSQNINILPSINFAIETMSTLISLLKVIASYFLMLTLVWSFSVPRHHIPYNRASVCPAYRMENWELLVCRSFPSIMVIRCASSAVFIFFLPHWLNKTLDGWAGAFVSARLLRATFRGIREPRLDILFERKRGPSDGSPEGKRRILSDHNTVLDVLETASSAPGVSSINGDEKQKQLEKTASVDSSV